MTRGYMMLALAGLTALAVSTASADERFFTYSYQADVLPEGQAEFEQYITNSSGKEDGSFTQWDFRSAIEYGITPQLMSPFYLNTRCTRVDGLSDGENGSDTEFKGISSEWVYQILNPNLDPVGLAVYAEYSTDGIDQELEGKIILSKRVDNWELALNAIYEGEYEREDGESEKEGTAEFTGGIAYKFDQHWSAGVEVRNKSAYPGGYNLSGQEYQMWAVGPNIHYGAPKWWATLTALPQVWGNGDGSNGNRQLEHEEELEVRLLFGIDI